MSDLLGWLLRALMYEVLEEGFFTAGGVEFGGPPPLPAKVTPRLPVRFAAPLNVFDLGDQDVLVCSMVIIAGLSLWFSMFLPTLPGGMMHPFIFLCWSGG